jgi:hypothetical protein
VPFHYHPVCQQAFHDWLWRANWENMKDDLNKLHEDIIKMKDQKSNVNAMWTHFQTKLEKSIYVNVPKQIARKKV